MKVYVLVKTESVTINYNSPDKCTYYDYLGVLGVYSELESLKNKLKQLNFIEEDIERLIKYKWLLGKNCYFLEEKEINQES